MANQEGKFNESNQILQKSFRYEQRKLNTPAIVLLIVSDNYEKQGDYKKSIEYLNYYINREFKYQHEQNLAAYKNKKKDFDYDKSNRKLVKSYEKKARLFSKLYLEVKENKKPLLLQSYKKKADFYQGLCEKFKENTCYESSQIIQKTQSHIGQVEKRKFRYNWFAQYALLYYVDDLALKNQNTLAQHDLDALSIAPCVGAGFAYRNYLYEYNIQSCAFFGQSYVKEGSRFASNANYEESVFVYGLLANAGFYGKFFHPKVPVGFSLATRYRKGDYPDATAAGDTFRVLDQATVSVGAFFEIKYEHKHYDYVFKSGAFDDLNSLLFVFQINVNHF